MVWVDLLKSKIFHLGRMEFFVVLISGSLWVSYLWTPLLFLWRLNVMSTNKKLSISMSVGISSTFSSFTFLDLTCIDTDSELLSVLGTVGTYILVWNIRNWYILKISRIGFFVFFSRMVLYLIANCNGQIPCSDLTRNYNFSRIYCADHFLWKGNKKVENFICLQI